MFDVLLVHLSGDASSADASLENAERPALSAEELKSLLCSFSAIDAIENAVAAPEIRVKVRSESYLLRTGQDKILLYDAIRRELPAVVLSVDEALAELDGSAPAARRAANAQQARTALAESAAQARPVPKISAARKPRLIAMALVAAGLGGAIVYLLATGGRSGARPNFQSLAAAELAELQPSLTGVYMTGNQPGQHGITFSSGGDLKIFELRALNAPRLVYAAGELGRVGKQLAVSTDQPGGLIEITGRDTLVYCGETYRRVR